MPLNFNVIIDTVAVLIPGLILWSERKRRFQGAPDERLFRLLLSAVICVFLLDIPAWLLDGRHFPGARGLCMVLDTAYYVCQIAYCYLWMLFSDYWNFRSENRLKRLALPYALPLLCELAVIAANPWTGWIFVIDRQNVYGRGTAFLVNLTPYYLYILGALALSLCKYCRDRDAERRRRSLSMLVFMFLPVCGVIIETLLYGISWIWPFTALSLLMVSLDAQSRRIMTEQVRAAREAEKVANLAAELTQSRMAIMLSQIQPHFLFNALSAIQELCHRNPPLAERATADFAEFLRGNLSSLSDNRPIAFARELEHTEHYLRLEKIRYAERLTVVYDILTTDFRLPTLTLQPIVENAVRHGLAKREDGGTVTIAAREEERAYVLTVSDDGVGFAPEAIPLPGQRGEEGRAHVGIDNVRQRLASMCGGTLEIASNPGAGTVAVITIPKEQALC